MQTERKTQTGEIEDAGFQMCFHRPSYGPVLLQPWDPGLTGCCVPKHNAQRPAAHTHC